MVPLDVKITGVIFQIFSTNSRRRARPVFDTLYILYKFLYTLTVKNTKIAEKLPNMVNFNFEWFESIKALKINNFLFSLLILDQNWRFPKDIKIAKKWCCFFYDFDIPRKSSILVWIEQTQQKVINFERFYWFKSFKIKIYHFWQFLGNFCLFHCWGI